MKEWVGECEVQNISASGYTIKNKPFESTFGINREEFDDDRLGIYSPIIQEYAQNAVNYIDDLVFGLLKKDLQTFVLTASLSFPIRTKSGAKRYLI